MIKYTVVEGIIKGRSKKQIFMKIEYENGEIKYRGINIRTRTWGNRYGPYHTIKQKAGSLRCYDCGAIDYDVDEVGVIENDVRWQDVMIGVKKIDNWYL